MFPPRRPSRPRSLFQIWQQPQPYQESFVPMTGPDAPIAVSPAKQAEVEPQKPKEDPALAARPASISLSTTGPWGPWSPAEKEDDKKRTFDVAPPFDEAGFQAQIQAILKKGYFFPSEFQGPLKSIAESAGNILAAMRTDPADVAEGERFLRRYLRIIDQLLESYRRVATGDPDVARRNSITKDTLSMLERLEAAFKKEHSDLLKNDVMSLSAEISTIDKLLKMEGH